MIEGHAGTENAFNLSIAKLKQKVTNKWLWLWETQILRDIFCQPFIKADIGENAGQMLVWGGFELYKAQNLFSK